MLTCGSAEFIIFTRGYYYDTESGLYYLQSRYYDPNAGRFLNADVLVSNWPSILNNNLFTYCGNSPLGNIDLTGTCYYNANGQWCHDNWEYLCGYNRKPEPIDLTEKLTGFMEKNANDLKTYKQTNGIVKAAVYFYKNVTDGGALDIKLQAEWKFEEGQLYSFNNQILRYDDPGNINFGYVGAVIFPESFLCFGAGMNQIKKHGFKFGDLSTWYDDPRDNAMIKYGYDIYVNGE